MKKIILVIVSSMFIVSGTGASEIFGQISTNPNAPAGDGNKPPVQEQPLNPIKKPVVQPSSGRYILPIKNQRKVQPEATPKPEVLGVKFYSDGTLLRGADRKIYLVQGKIKKYIAGLDELKKYHGRAVIKATAEELSALETREHLDGELIRQRGEARVYVIIKGVKQHILNLEMLRANYSGREIFNLSPEQMVLF